MKITTIVSTRNVLIQRIHHDDGMIETCFCAVGRFSKWPKKMMDPMWANITAIARDRRDQIRKGII